MVNLGDLYVSEGRVADGDLLLREAVAEAQKALPSGHRVTGKALKSYGRCLTRLKRYAGAEAALLEAHKILTAADANLARKAAENIVELYEAWGKPDKAAAWRARPATP